MSIVTKIADGAFRDSKIGSITFEKQENITGIGRVAFYNCTNLTEITIPKNVKIILPHTFENCSQIKNINIPSNITKIGQYAFSKCASLTNIDISNSVKEIGWAAFEMTALTSVEIPNSVTKIDHYAFSNCNNLTSSLFRFKAETLEELKNYGYTIFNDCDNFVEIYIPYESFELYKELFNQYEVIFYGYVE